MDFYSGYEDLIEFATAVEENPFGAQLLSILENQFDSLPDAVEALVEDLQDAGLEVDEDGVVALLTGELDGEVFLPSAEVVEVLEGYATNEAEAMRLRNAALQAYELAGVLDDEDGYYDEGDEYYDVDDEYYDVDDEYYDDYDDVDDEYYDDYDDVEDEYYDVDDEYYDEDDEYDDYDDLDDEYYEDYDDYDDVDEVGDEYYDEDDMATEEELAEEEDELAKEAALEMYSRQVISDELKALSERADEMMVTGEGLMTPYIKQLLFGNEESNQYANFTAAVEEAGLTEDEYLKCLEFSLDLLTELQGLDSIYFSTAANEEIAESNSARLLFGKNDDEIEREARTMLELLNIDD